MFAVLAVVVVEQWEAALDIGQQAVVVEGVSIQSLVVLDKLVLLVDT